MKKNIKLLLLAIIITIAMLPAKADVHHEVTSKVTQFNYSNYTYTYTDANGEEKTANLTDEAVSTNQMIALMKKIYTDPEIPGIHYAYDYKDAEGNPYQRKKINYNYCINQGAPWTREGTVDDPDQDGMTMLLVQVKDNFKSSMLKGASVTGQIDLAFQSLKLVKNFTRVHDENNPGYLLSVDGISTNRFFFLSKGKPRASKTPPLYMLFEQVSPVNYASASETTNFIDEMRLGHSYSCVHDCGNVIGWDPEHWFTINKSGENYSLANLTIFMPDRRFEYNLNPNENCSDTDSDSERYKNYGRDKSDNSEFHPMVAPKVLMYTADLNAEAVPSGNNDGFYQVNLNWGTSFTEENLYVNIPQHFYVYIVAPDGSRTLIQEVQKDEDGLVVTRDYSYEVEQLEETQTFSYVITAHTINYDNNGDVIFDSDNNPYITISAESPVRTVTIPGRKHAFFSEVSEYRSRYHIEGSGKEYNLYKNTVSITPSSLEYYGTIQETPYRIYRNYGTVTDKYIATVTFTPMLNEDGTKYYNYTVEYESGTQDLDFLFDDEVPVTSGTITGFDNSTVKIIDRFKASTVSNGHFDKYVYVLKEQKGENGYYYACSNTFEVPVFKTENVVSGEGRTLDEVIADTDHSAKATPDNAITFLALNNPAANVVDYEIRRLNQNNFKNFTKIGKAENYNNSGEYYIYALSNNGQLNELVGIESISSEGGTITTLDVNSSSVNQISSYVPVINTLYNGDFSKPNSYGCDIKRMRYPQVELVEKNVMKTNPFAGATSPMMGYMVTLQIVPKMPSSDSDVNYVYYYRLWRKVLGNDSPTLLSNERLLNYEDEQSGVDEETQQTTWESDYDCLYTIYPGEDNKQVNDIFLDLAYDGTKKVKYIVRLYATSIYGTGGGAIDHITRGVDGAGSGKDYFIAEDTYTVTFNNDTPTAVGTINAEAQPASVTYYNTMGVASNRPFPGINIIVTRNTDGTTTTCKQLF